MKRQKNKDPLDEALKLIFLESLNKTATTEDSTELDHLMSAKYSHNIKASKRSVMINKIHKSISTLTFGELLNQNLKKHSITCDQLAEEINVITPVIENLKNDSVLITTIPANYLHQILKKLNISFHKAEQSIIKTYELLKGQIISGSIFQGVQIPLNSQLIALNKNTTTNSNIKIRKDIIATDSSIKSYLNDLEELMKK